MCNILICNAWIFFPATHLHGCEKCNIFFGKLVEKNPTVFPEKMSSWEKSLSRIDAAPRVKTIPHLFGGLCNVKSEKWHVEKWSHKNKSKGTSGKNIYLVSPTWSHKNELILKIPKWSHQIHSTRIRAGHYHPKRSPSRGRNFRSQALGDLISVLQRRVALRPSCTVSRGWE